MKRVLILLFLCVAMVISLFGCTQGNRDDDTVPGTTMNPMITQYGGDQGAGGGAQGNQGPGSLGGT